MNIYSKISNIYEHIVDAPSKYIFEKRLAYSLSGNGKEVDDIVMSEMRRYKDEDVMNRCIKWISEQKCDKVSVFGAGFAGYQITKMLLLNRICIEKVYDNSISMHNKKMMDVPICQPVKDSVDADEKVVIGTNGYRKEIFQQLIGLGIPEKNIYMPDALWWLGKYPQYFDEEILPHASDEIFIDGGSLDGGDSKNFVSWCDGRYKEIYAFEPAVDNLNKIKKTADEIRDFKICPVGMWNEKSTLKFLDGKAENCSISERGNISIEVDSIDNILDGRPATYIKMDIEGSELKAIEGAKRTIKTYKPKLAICVYHKPEDIIDIPLKILELNPNYKFYLRHYSYVETETVLYAINGGDE